MKRLLPLLCLLLLLAGCAGSPNYEARTVSPEKTAHLSTAVLTRPTPPSLMDILTPLEGMEDVYAVQTNALEGLTYPSMTKFGSLLVFCTQDYDYESDTSTLGLTAMNSHTGFVPAQTGFSTVDYVYPQVRGNTLYLCDSTLGWVKGLDKELALVSDTAVESHGTQWLVSTDGNTLYQMEFMGACTRLDLTTGESQPFATELYDLFSTDRNQDYAFLSYVGTEELLSCVGSLDLATGEVEESPFNDTMSSVKRWEDCWLGYRFDGAYSYYDGTQTWVIQPPAEYELLLLPESGHLLMRNYSSRHLMLYDRDGTFLAECTLDLGAECFPNDDLVWSEFYGGYYITLTSYDGSAQLLFWRLTPSEGEPLTMLTEEEYEVILPGDAVDAALYARAAQLSAEYGVDIRIADQCGTEYSDYYTVQVTDEEAITAALDILEQVLASYPDGFIDQLVYDSIRKIQIHLSGQLTGWNGHEMSTAGAFTQPAGEVYLMVMDIYQYQLEANFYHEFSHIIDRNLEWHAQHEDSIFSEDDWRALSPESADYSFSYGVWPSIWGNDLEPYFVDSYARTYPTEDRARIMEYAMMDWDWAFDEEHLPMVEKLRYYSLCIRDCFNTEGWPEVCLWEEPLQEG